MSISYPLVNGRLGSGIAQTFGGVGITRGIHFEKLPLTRGNRLGNHGETQSRILTPTSPPSVGGGSGVWVGYHHKGKCNMGEVIFVIIIGAFGAFVGMRYAKHYRYRKGINKNNHTRRQHRPSGGNDE
jgi:hypothetical protein